MIDFDYFFFNARRTIDEFDIENLPSNIYILDELATGFNNFMENRLITTQSEVSRFTMKDLTS